MVLSVGAFYEATHHSVMRTQCLHSQSSPLPQDYGCHLVCKACLHPLIISLASFTAVPARWAANRCKGKKQRGLVGSFLIASVWILISAEAESPWPAYWQVAMLCGRWQALLTLHKGLEEKQAPGLNDRVIIEILSKMHPDVMFASTHINNMPAEFLKKSMCVQTWNRIHLRNVNTFSLFSHVCTKLKQLWCESLLRHSAQEHMVSKIDSL